MLIKTFLSILLFFAVSINCSEKDKKADAEKGAKSVGASVAQAAVPAPALAAAQMSRNSTVVVQATEKEIVATLKAINTIKQVALAVAQKVKDEDGTDLQLKNMGELSPYPRTVKGLQLKGEAYPESLLTPWGEIKFYGGASYDGRKKIFKVFDHFRKELALQFIDNSGQIALPRLSPQDRAIMRFYKDGKEIAEKDLAECVGTSAQISANLCGYPSRYNITAVNGTPVPQVRIFKKSEGRKCSEAIGKKRAAVAERLKAKL